jgi:tight adherence protein C
MVVTLLASAWALFAATPFVRWARRESVRARAGGLAPSASWEARRRARVAVPRPVALVVAVLSAPMRARRRRQAASALAGDVPVVVDLLAVAVGAGCTPYAAVEIAAQWCPPALSRPMRAIVDEVRHGEAFERALRNAARATPALEATADALEQATRLGAPIAPTLARLAAEARADLRRAAEARARTIPVRLLFPLVFLVLPAFGLLTVAPVLLDGLAMR